MQVRYAIVHAEKLWHILRLWHRLYFFSFDCEAIAEHVASVARYIEKRHAVGRPLEAPHLIRSTKLRAAGVRGDLTDVGVLKRALDIFQGQAASSPFLICSRTLQERIRKGFLGPSVPVHRIRTKERSAVENFRLSFLMGESSALRHLAKDVACFSKVASPSTHVDEDAWEATEQHVKGIHSVGVAGLPIPCKPLSETWTAVNESKAEHSKRSGQLHAADRCKLSCLSSCLSKSLKRKSVVVKQEEAPKSVSSKTCTSCEASNRLLHLWEHRINCAH